MAFKYYNYKYQKKQKQEETETTEKEINNTNTNCLCCKKETFNDNLFCLNCYNTIKGIRAKFDHNRTERNIQNHYFELRDKCKNIIDENDFSYNIRFMFALSEELVNIYENDYLAERVKSDIKTAFNQFQKTYEDEKEKNLAKEFNDRDFREQWPREYQCEDGHYVRSKSELAIDNWLYNHGYIHAYEKSVFMESRPNAIVLSDFYLPNGDVYIEFWGLEEDEKYEKRKQFKIKLYEENNLNRIDLTDKDVQRLNDILPRLITKFKK